MKKLKKLGVVAASAALSTALVVGGAAACTMIYVGADLTDTGDTYFARSEDYTNYYNKIGYVSEHGRHAERHGLRAGHVRKEQRRQLCLCDPAGKRDHP